MDKTTTLDQQSGQWRVYVNDMPPKAQPIRKPQSHIRRFVRPLTNIYSGRISAVITRAKSAAGKVSGAFWGSGKKSKWTRSSAAICLMLLGAMALTQVNTPWGQNAVTTLSSAINVRFEIDETIGKLQFVKNALPEAVQVFWDAGAAFKLKTPVKGGMTHTYTDDQPWTEYSNVEGGVHASAAGEVRQVENTGDKQYAMRIEHSNGYESIYAYFTSTAVKPGDKVKVGDLLGQSALDEDGKPHLYWEVRKNGAPIDPRQKLS